MLMFFPNEKYRIALHLLKLVSFKNNPKPASDILNLHDSATKIGACLPEIPGGKVKLSVTYYTV